MKFVKIIKDNINTEAILADGDLWLSQKSLVDIYKVMKEIV